MHFRWASSVGPMKRRTKRRPPTTLERRPRVARWSSRALASGAAPKRPHKRSIITRTRGAIKSRAQLAHQV